MDSIDNLILSNIGKWGFLIAKQIIAISPLSERTTYRRIKNLIDIGYLKRERVLYGVPALYSLTHKGRMYQGLNKRENKYHLEQIEHDITVVDVAISFLDTFNLKMEDIKSEKELHSIQGFGSRKHVPDFLFKNDGKSFAVEVELSLKAKETLSKNIQLNFNNYDNQIWVIRKNNHRLKERICENEKYYPNITIKYLEDII